MISTETKFATLTARNKTWFLTQEDMHRLWCACQCQHLEAYGVVVETQAAVRRARSDPDAPRQGSRAARKLRSAEHDAATAHDDYQRVEALRDMFAEIFYAA